MIIEIVTKDEITAFLDTLEKNTSAGVDALRGLSGSPVPTKNSIPARVGGIAA